VARRYNKKVDQRNTPLVESARSVLTRRATDQALRTTARAWASRLHAAPAGAIGAPTSVGATRARDTVEYAYRRGGQSLLDFLDAQRSYRETALAHLQALGAHLDALYQLEADIGGRLDQ
jgi:outer membrane protein TolC